MKATFSIWLLTLAVLVFFPRCDKEPGTDAGEPVYIPDQSFLYALLDLGIDTDGDSLISEAEAEAVTRLDISDRNIADMTGIEMFRYLRTLNCSYNQIPALDVSSCLSLGELNCTGNRLSYLSLSSNAVLNKLFCRGNQLLSLDVSKNRSLESLYCGNNPLTGLDLSGNLSLSLLHCQFTQLSSLDISSNVLLETLSLANIPSLPEICVWTLPFPPEGVSVDTTGSPNIIFTMECSQ